MVQKYQYSVVVVDVNIFCEAVATETPTFTGHQRLILNLSNHRMCLTLNFAPLHLEPHLWKWFPLWF